METEQPKKEHITPNQAAILLVLAQDGSCKGDSPFAVAMAMLFNKEAPGFSISETWPELYLKDLDQWIEMIAEWTIQLQIYREELVKKIATSQKKPRKPRSKKNAEPQPAEFTESDQTAFESASDATAEPDAPALQFDLGIEAGESV